MPINNHPGIPAAYARAAGLPARLDDATRTLIVTGIRARLGQQVEIAIEEVDEIAAEASGKYRYVVSKII